MTILLIAAALVAAPQDTQIEIVEMRDAPQPRVFMMRLADTREETARQAAELFDARDKDKNGYLEGEELAMAHGGMMMGMPGHPMPPMPPMAHHEAMDPAKMFDKIDTDGNGAISREEFAAHHKDHAMPAMPMMIHKREGHGAAPHDGAKPMVVHRKVERDGDKETHEVIVERGDAPAGEDVQVFVRRMGEGGEWADTEGRKLQLEKIEQWVASAKEDADGDGRVSRQEAIDKALSRFDALDKDGDGTLGEDERVHVFARVVEHRD